MKVLMLSWEYPPHIVGGLGKHVAELSPALARQGMTLHIVTPVWGREEHTNERGLYIHRIAAPSGLYPDFYSQAVQTNEALTHACEVLWEEKGPFALIHNHDWLTSFTARELKHKFKVPLLATIHATERGRGRGYLGSEEAHKINDAEWWLTYEAWRVICCTHYMAEEIQRYFDTPADKIDVIPNGVDPRPFQELEGLDLSDFRLRYALPHEKIVLYVGRIVYEKGVRILVQAIPKVLHDVPEAKFVIAGKGPELANIQALAEELGVSQKVYMPGFIDNDERNRLYKVADCAVFPSLYEPFGIVALEAMAARTPVVVSEVGGLREVVRHGETGITIYPNDPDSCAWGIIHTLQHPEWARQRVENAYQEVLTVYNWDSIAARTIEVYQRIVDERARTDW
ncbi:MAG: glycosyltransferase family 4 protein [Anaerolineae bacterium]|nr:glycosyltransferase family 4 protein [Anaerolineae bacterium]